MVAGTTQAVISPYVGVSIGDEFEYEVTIFHIKHEVNNTVYINKNPFGMEGNKVIISVDDIIEEEYMDFFGFVGDNRTKIITTESFAGKSFDSYSFLDEWFETFGFLTFYYEFFPLSFNPETYSFEEPEPYNDSDDRYEGLPIFASTNKSFYQQLNDTFSNPLELPQMKYNLINGLPIKLGFESYEVGYWEDRNEFYLNVSLYSSNTGTTSSEVGWDLNLGVTLEVHVDFAKGLVKDLDYSMHQYVAVGTSSALMKARQAFKIVGGDDKPTFTLDSNLIAPTLTILGLVAIIVIRKKIILKN